MFALGLLRDLLAKEPLAVEQTHTTKREVDIAGRLEMVACENAETARILGQYLADPELGGEIGHLWR